ncbi:MAG: hemolysin family protein [Candidatus Krumholzibacteria bacterium]|nr:hemolysin family protein [Candidatus Krumholzibacteria bacterium]
MEPTSLSDPGHHLALALTVAVLLALSAFFSGSETALFSLSRSTVAGMAEGDPSRRRVASLLRRPRRLLVTILFGNLLVNVANTSVVTALAIRMYGEAGVGYAMLLMTVLILVFGEISPKSLAIRRAPAIAVAVAPVLGALMAALWPVRVALGWIADSSVEVGRRLFGETREEYGSLELAAAVEMGHRDGLFDEFEKEVLTNLFLFAETSVHEILTPRVDVFSLDVSTPLQEAVRQVRDRGFTRVPLYEGRPETIVGVLHAKDLLRTARDDRVALRDLVREVRFVPETKKIRDLLGELIAARQHMVIAVDEHGSYEGIVTLEDILEEIFGDIRDRREPRVDEYTMIGPDAIVASGSMRLEDFNDIFRSGLESQEVETVGGYLTETTGRIPHDGEAFEAEGLRFLVISADPTRINKLKVERLPRGEESDEQH